MTDEEAVEFFAQAGISVQIDRYAGSVSFKQESGAMISLSASSEGWAVPFLAWVQL